MAIKLTPRRMGSVNLVVIVESMRTIATHKGGEDTNALHVPSLIAVGAALGTSSSSHVEVHPRVNP